MTIEHSGALLARVSRQTFNAFHATGFGAALVPGIEIHPLFVASHNAGRPLALAASLEPEWVVATPVSQPNKHPWDIAHEHARGTAAGAQAFGASPDIYFEPDLLHPSPMTDHALAPPDRTLNPAYPPSDKSGFNPAWHLTEQYGNFLNAWKMTTGADVRIAHLDTGYSSVNKSIPRNLRPEQGYNFYENNTNAIDPGLKKGLLDTPGHGTATLALLAGGHVTLEFEGQTYEGDIGGAPDAEVVPVRIAPSVVHLYTRPLAQGLDYAIAPRNAAPCQVVSLSHGGLPSSVWAAAVNRCYEAGVLIVAASGDSFYLLIANLPTHFTVYPSAFNRVLTATGITFSKKPYKTNQLLTMQGCWGPDSVMTKAIGGYTPNVPWMRLKEEKGWDMDGGGTSAATPQIAATAALWLSRYGSKFAVPWQRVAACREALLNAAKAPTSDLSEIGRGGVDAVDALDEVLADKLVKMAHDGTLPKAPTDEVSFPFWRLLFGIAPPNGGVDQMYETEAAQILARSRNADLHKAVAADLLGKQLDADPKRKRDLQNAFLAEPDMSVSLRSLLTAKILP